RVLLVRAARAYRHKRVCRQVVPVLGRFDAAAHGWCTGAPDHTTASKCKRGARRQRSHCIRGSGFAGHSRFRAQLRTVDVAPARSVTSFLAKRVAGLVRQPASAGSRRVKAILLTALSSGAAKVVSTATALVSAPLTVHYLGPERFG